jgi:hypothetical protein
MTKLSELVRRSNTFKPLTKILEDVHRMAQVQKEQLRATLLSDPKHLDPKRLNRYELQHFSQNGEDGIIAEIFHRISTEGKVFVEIGAGDGLENNTAYLLIQGWTGFWFDAGPTYKRMQENASRYITANRVVVSEEFLTAENVAATLERVGVPKQIDLLSVDIDRNTSFVWKALAAWRPRAAIIEYNPAFSPSDSWEVSYQPKLAWNGTLYYGASLLKLEEIGREMGYVLVGCGMAGVNAFFVREDLVGDKFCAPFTARNHYEPPRHYLSTQRVFKQGFDDCELVGQYGAIAKQGRNGKLV